MKNTISVLTMSASALFANLTLAEDLTYPTTESDIVSALSIKDGTTTVDGVEYVTENGKIYKVINGERYRMRAMMDIVDTDIVPKAKALIQFGFNSAAIKPESYNLLDKYASALQGGLADATLQICGHTDSKGSDEANMELSRNRAAAVRAYLIQAGVTPERLEAEGFGEDKPVAPNTTETGRAKNRRVEFVRIE